MSNDTINGAPIEAASALPEHPIAPAAIPASHGTPPDPRGPNTASTVNPASEAASAADAPSQLHPPQWPPNTTLAQICNPTTLSYELPSPTDALTLLPRHWDEIRVLDRISQPEYVVNYPTSLAVAEAFHSLLRDDGASGALFLQVHGTAELKEQLTRKRRGRNWSMVEAVSRIEARVLSRRSQSRGRSMSRRGGDVELEVEIVIERRPDREAGWLRRRLTQSGPDTYGAWGPW